MATGVDEMKGQDSTAGSSASALPLAALLLSFVLVGSVLLSVYSALRGVPSMWCEDNATGVALELIQDGRDSTVVNGRFSPLPFGVTCRYEIPGVRVVEETPTWGATFGLFAGLVLGIAGVATFVVNAVRSRSRR